MDTQADDPRSSHQQLNNSNAIQCPGKATFMANLIPESLQQSFPERQAAKLQMVHGVQAASHTPSVGVQESVPAQFTLETQPFCAVFPPEGAQAKCRQTMCFSAVDANAQAPAASPLHSLRCESSHQIHSYKLLRKPLRFQLSVAFSLLMLALLLMFAMDSCQASFVMTPQRTLWHKNVCVATHASSHILLMGRQGSSQMCLDPVRTLQVQQISAK